MANTLKDTLIDKATDCLLDLLADTSKEEINDLLDKNRQQKILFKVISNFANSVYFKSEYKNVLFQENKDIVFSIPSENISPAATVEQITNALSKVVEQCFLTEDKNVLPTIAHHIAILYLQRAKLTVQLFDVVKVQHEGFNEITDDVHELKNIILSNHRYELQLRQEKENLLKKELNNEVTSVICEMLNYYLYFVLKKAPVFSGKEMDNLGIAMTRKINDITNHITDFVKDDFCKTPVCVTKVNGLESQTEEINYFIYSECYFRNLILKNTDELLKYNDIIDIESYVLILRLRNKLQGVLFPPLLQMGQTNILKCSNFNIDTNFFCKELAEIGNLLVLLYTKMLI